MNPKITNIMAYNPIQTPHISMAFMYSFICWIGTLLTFIAWDALKIGLSIVLLVVSIAAGLFSIKQNRASERKTKLEIKKLELEIKQKEV